MTDTSKPNPSPGFIRLANVTVFSNVLRAQGINPDAAFHAYGLSPSSVEDTKLFVHSEVVYGLSNAFADLAKDPFLGIRVGEDFAFSSWPPFAQSAAGAATLAEFLVRYIQMIPTEVNSVTHALSIMPDQATYKVIRPADPAVAPVQATGFGCAQYIRVFKVVTGTNWDASKITFKSRYITGIPPGYQGLNIVQSGNPGLEISFPVEWLFHPLQIDIQAAAGRTEVIAPEVSMITALRSALQGRLDAPDLGVDAVAALLGLQGDLLVKALKKNKTTLAKEVKRLKIQTAKKALAETTKTVLEIGKALGYPDSAHFIRFFRSQTGQTPGQYREKSFQRDA